MAVIPFACGACHQILKDGADMCLTIQRLPCPRIILGWWRSSSRIGVRSPRNWASLVPGNMH